MDRVAYITGSSRGIGKTLAELLLENDWEVIGLSRSNSIEHPHYTYQELDLNDLSKVRNYIFKVSGEQVLLVNNAGAIGEIGAVGTIPNETIEQVMNINTIAPQILMNNFIRQFDQKEGHFHILNISSGAGKRPIDAWASYCASKAAIDLFSETIADELDWRGKSNWTIHSCAPGVVDTKMQNTIRSADPENFKSHQKFIDLKENGELSSAAKVAGKLYQLITSPDQFPDTIVSVRDF